MIIRTEELRDHEDVYALNYHAFEEREDESKLIERIRSSSSFIPELSLIAELDQKVVGHALFSKAEVVGQNGSHDVIVLAPVAVHPDHQRQGIGTKLIQEGLRRCTQLGFGVVLLLGHPAYYPRLGFKPASYYGFTLTQFEVPDDVFMANELFAGVTLAIPEELRYPKAFFEKD